MTADTPRIRVRLTPTEARRLSNRRVRHTVRRDCRAYRCRKAAALTGIETAERRNGGR